MSSPVGNRPKRKTYSPASISGEVVKKQRGNENVGEIENFLTVEQSLNQDLDLDQGVKLLIKLQSESNQKIDRMLSRLDYMNDWLKNIDEAIVDLEDRVSVLENRQSPGEEAEALSQIRNENSSLSLKVIELEDRSRRNNIIISGLEEKGEESWEDTFRVVKSLLENQLDLKNLDCMEIERAHRIGRRLPNRHRLIVCRLLHFRHREEILKSSVKLKGSGIYINEDFSRHTRTARFHLRRLAKDLKSKDSTLSTRIKYNKLIAGDKVFVYDPDNGCCARSVDPLG